ncbi:hypothetical protein DMB66_33905 [Actinoplanes sp. ATCC 53533]|nr:hypothetical protein DMB66_33905 [Actinoplanes sp. ATCC 53533]
METAELLKLRESEYEHFERFRKTLVEAIAEAIEKATTEDPEKIARSVWRDTIEPEVADIQSKISASKRSLSFKLAAGIAVGSATTAFGALAAMPFVITAGIAAAATPLLQAYKYFDDRQAVELSQMYFLWKASKHGHG